MASIEQVRAINNPQRAYMWQVEFVGSPVGGAEVMTLHSTTANIGGVSTDPIEINFKSEKHTFAGRTASGRTVSFDFIETENGETYSFLRSLYNLTHDETDGTSANRADYSFDLVIKLLATDDETVTQTHTFKGAYVSEIAEVSLDYGSNEAMTISATFAYQKHNTGDGE